MVLKGTEKMDNDFIAALVAAQIATTFGHKVSANPYEESRSRGGDQFFSLPIDGSFGIFSMIMKDAHIRIVAGKVESAEHGEHYNVRAALHYTHVGGGSNGSNIGTFWYTKKGELIEFRAG